MERVKKMPRTERKKSVSGVYHAKHYSSNCTQARSVMKDKGTKLYSIHTVAVVYDGTNYTTYNRHGSQYDSPFEYGAVCRGIGKGKSKNAGADQKEAARFVGLRFALLIFYGTGDGTVSRLIRRERAAQMRTTDGRPYEGDGDG